MMFWWKEYVREWKVNLFIIIQMVLVLFYVNTQITFLWEEWNILNSIQKSQDNLYFYQNALSTICEGIVEEENFQTAEKELKQLDGMEGIAYAAGMYCGVEGYQNEMNPESVVENYNMTPLLWKGIRYPLKEGRWFQETDAEDTTLQVIIGGGLSQKYRVGDTIVLDYGEGTPKEAFVIGNLGSDFYMLNNDCSFSAEGGYVDTYVKMYTEQEDILLSNDKSWFQEFQNEASYPSSSVMLKVREGADFTEYEKYGVLFSFDKIMENTEQRCKRFVMDAINNNAVWILVIIFAVASVAYMTAQRRRYVWGIYSLFGVSGSKMLGRLMLHNLITYILGAITACLAAPSIGYLLNYQIPIIRGIHVMAMGILIALLLGISYVCNRYIRRIEPKTILLQTKE